MTQSNILELKLVGSRVALRFGTHDDIPEIIAFYQKNQQFLQQFSDPRPEEHYKQLFWSQELDQRLVDFEKDQALRLFIFNKDTGAIIGFCNFFNFVRGAFHACYLGYGLAEKAAGKGLMMEALEQGIKYVFERLNLHRIMANYDPENYKSALLLERLGFQKEGLAKNYLYYHKRWNDHILTALSNEAWNAPQQKKPVHDQPKTHTEAL